MIKNVHICILNETTGGILKQYVLRFLLVDVSVYKGLQTGSSHLHMKTGRPSGKEELTYMKLYE